MAGGDILSGNNAANKRFGFSGDRGSVITHAPKLSDQWFVEFTSDGTPDSVYWGEVSSFAKSVSPISVNVTYQSIDQYGKRVHIPNRVDFPEVTIELHDRVDGKTFQLMSNIYNFNFNNNSLLTDAGNLDATIKDNNSGFVQKPTPSQPNNNFFTKITVYHFFGNAKERNNGIQKVVLVNPLVSNMTISGGDYTTAELRTISLTLAPENVIISDGSGGTEQDATFPTWMEYGLNMIDELATIRSDQFGGLQPSQYSAAQEERLRNQMLSVNSATGSTGITGTSFEGQAITRNYRGVSSADGDNGAVRLAKQLGVLTNTTMNYGGINGTSAPTENFALKYSDIKAGENDSGSTRLAVQLQQLLQHISENGGIDGVAFVPRSNPTMPSGTLIPTDIPDFADTMSQSVGNNQNVNIGDFANILRSELINSFFNGTKFSLNTVGNKVAQSIVGNTGIGTIRSAPVTASSKYGVAGDILRDSILDVTAPRQPVTSRGTTISAAPTAKDVQQNNINTLIAQRRKI